MENTGKSEMKTETVEPDSLLAKVNRPTFASGLFVSVVLHVVLILATSVGLLLVWTGDWERFGLRSPSAIKTIRKADEKSAAETARAEKAKKEAEEAAAKAAETKAAETKTAEKAAPAAPAADVTQPKALPLDAQVDRKRPKDIDLDGIDL